MFTQTGIPSGTIRPDTTVRNMLDRLGISELLNQPGVTEVLINRPGSYFWKLQPDSSVLKTVN